MRRTHPYLKEVGNRIKQIRKSKGITLRQLGKMCDLDYSGICQIETGQRNILLLNLKTIADALEVDIKGLL